MSFANLYNKILLCTGKSKAPLTRNELVYVSAMFVKEILKKNPFDQTLNSTNSDIILLNISKHTAGILQTTSFVD